MTFYDDILDFRRSYSCYVILWHLTENFLFQVTAIAFVKQFSVGP